MPRTVASPPFGSFGSTGGAACSVVAGLAATPPAPASHRRTTVSGSRQRPGRPGRVLPSETSCARELLVRRDGPVGVDRAAAVANRRAVVGELPVPDVVGVDRARLRVETILSDDGAFDIQ